MKINIFDQGTEAGRARLSIFELGTLTFGLASTSIGEFLSIIGVFPLTPFGLGIPICLVTGILATLCFIPLVIKISRYSEIKKKEEKPRTEKRRHRKYSLPDGQNDLMASSDTNFEASGRYGSFNNDELFR